jgi:hypothetical protein
MTEPAPEIVELAAKLHQVFCVWAGNMGLGDHLPETWWAVAKAALESRELSSKTDVANFVAADAGRAE